MICGDMESMMRHGRGWEEVNHPANQENMVKKALLVVIIFLLDVIMQLEVMIVPDNCFGCLVVMAMALVAHL